MPKRKSSACGPAPPPPAALTLSSLDAALDLLACDTFTRIDALGKKFESAAGIKLQDGILKGRWEEAVKRYWVMKSMDDLCCGASRIVAAADVVKDEDVMEAEGEAEPEAGPSTRRDSGGRALPQEVHRGAVLVWNLDKHEESEWRRWTPKVGDLVLVDTKDYGIWPGKIIDRQSFYRGRTVPRGSHFFPVRFYCDGMSPTVTVKSRLLPFHLRPDPPLLSSEALTSAYNHATCPSTFDKLAFAAEALAAHNRTHPGVSDDPVDLLKVKAEKEEWNQVVNWVMNERRVEKLRSLNEEREKRLAAISKSTSPETPREELGNMLGSPLVPTLKSRRDCGNCADCNGDCDGEAKRRRRSTGDGVMIERISNDGERGGIFKLSFGRDRQRSHSPATTSSIFGPSATSNIAMRRTASPFAPGYIRPALSTPQRPMSPRRTEKRRSGVFSGSGELSPRIRGSTWTPPRILPSGDETAPSAYASTGSPVPSRQKFDFISPLGPVRLGKLGGMEGDSDSPAMPKLGRADSLGAGLESVKEEPGEEDGWTMVRNGRKKRAGSAPCLDGPGDIVEVVVGPGSTEVVAVTAGGVTDGMEM